MFHGFGFAGGENLSGGLCAKGIPRNLFTVAVAASGLVVVPAITPASIVTVGKAHWHAVTAANSKMKDLDENIVNE